VENQTIQPNQSSATNNPSVTPPPNSNKGLLIGLIVLLAIIAAGMGGYVLRGELERDRNLSEQESVTVEGASTTAESRAEETSRDAQLSIVVRGVIEEDPETPVELELGEESWYWLNLDEVRVVENTFGEWNLADVDNAEQEKERLEADSPADAFRILDKIQITSSAEVSLSSYDGILVEVSGNAGWGYSNSRVLIVDSLRVL